METSYVIEIFINYNSNPGLMTMPHYFIDNLFSIESNSTFYSSTVYGTTYKTRARPKVSHIVVCHLSSEPP